MGYEVSLFLASRGCRVIIADVVTYQYLDLASLTSVRKCAAILLFNEPRLDIIINNAGCAGFKHKTEDDIYKVLQVNYIGHFLLTHLLTPLLIKTKHSRVVFVTSLLAFTNNLHLEKEYKVLYTVHYQKTYNLVTS
ncbi:dehydrogenase/reductase SDR family member 13-like [Atheta coriaria]|uniref:dehydrogenase/reductase SDR family member 13-like n=1 Tax=Dalotia coriaria TaxID=877792 RepID=UPI0031F345B3